MQNWFAYFLDAVLPETKDVKAARAISEAELAALVAPREAGAGWITAVFPYRDERVRALVRAAKYHGETRALKPAGRIFGECLLELISEKQSLGGWERPLITPIPVSRERLRARGYNQAERLLLSALPALGDAAEYAPTLLARRDRKSQVSVPDSERPANIAGAFFVLNPTPVSGRFVILIDDVVESGATLSDARRALLEAGAADVAAAAFAH